ncbi:unnamed protein product [Ilex paraguariensis]|uniref:Uncharacterized protein n=1 Tax=Ilex paraguariensis TaxID=185542 RepID=A0ABC8TTR4_9AQUA
MKFGEEMWEILKNNQIRYLRFKMTSLEEEDDEYEQNHPNHSQQRHVQRPLLSFGPKASMKLKTCPANVCKELRSSSQLISEFCTESSVMITDGSFSASWLNNLKKPMGSLVFSQENGSGTNSDAFQFCAQPSSIPGSVLQLVGSSYLVRATTWEIYGREANQVAQELARWGLSSNYQGCLTESQLSTPVKNRVTQDRDLAPLARINALVFTTCFADSSSSADVALAHSKLIQHLAIYKGYKEAFSALKIAEEKFLSVSKSRILLVKLQLLHERALHRGNLKLAQQLCDELGVLASSVIGVDMELKTQASLRHARTLLAANQFSQVGWFPFSSTSYVYKVEILNKITV